MDQPGDKPCYAGSLRLFRAAGVQRAGILLSIVARMPGYLDWINLFGSPVRYDEEAWGRTLAAIGRLLGAFMFLLLHPLAGLFRVGRKRHGNFTFANVSQ
jgi:hypothetical protein